MSQNFACNNCNARLYPLARYCSICGSELIKLSWKTQAANRLILENTQQITGDNYISVILENKGVTPVSVQLPLQKNSSPLHWIDSSKLKSMLSESLVIQGNSQKELQIPVKKSVYDIMFSQQIFDASLLQAELYFLTSHVQNKNNKWSYAPLSLNIAISKPPFIRPNLAVIRYLCWEILDDTEDSFSYEFELCNYSEHELYIKNVQIEDSEDTELLGIENTFERGTITNRISVDDIFTDCDFSEFQSVKPYEPIVISLKMSNRNQDTHLGAFLGKITVHLSNEKEHTITCSGHIGGVIGKAPRIEIDHPHVHKNIHRPIEVHIRNPGDVPLKLNGISIFADKEEKEDVTDTDWLIVDARSKSILESTIQPKQEATILLNIDISQKEQAQANEYEHRFIVIHHENDARFPAKVNQTIHFGKTDVLTKDFIGVDFGTTNTMISFFASQKTKHQILKIEGNNKKQQMQSLLWYTSQSREPFYFGEKAFQNHGLAPQNLVRSMKTIVNRDPDESVWFFDSQENTQKSSTARELLAVFVHELKQRAEQSLINITDQEKIELGLSGNNFQLQTAIFTHPVGIKDESMKALMEAAHQAGLNKNVHSLEEFKGKYCLDESSAALLSFMYKLTRDSDFIEAFAYDVYDTMDEKIICVDIGGGTTDVTIVHLYYDVDQSNWAYKTLASEGSEASHFAGSMGGDDIDLALVKHVLLKMKRTSNDAERIKYLEKASFDYFDIKNFQNYYTSEQSVGHTSREEQKRLDREASEIFQAARDLKQRCEEAKISLSKNPQQAATIQTAFIGVEGSAAVSITQEEFQKIIHTTFQDIQKIIDDAVQKSGLSYSDLSILLFTGQTTYLRILRTFIKEHFTRRMDTKQFALIVEPEVGASKFFCPKSCVAHGASIFRNIDGYFGREEAKASSVLLYDILTFPNKKIGKIEGLQKGASFPIKTALPLFKKPKGNQFLFKEGERKEFARIEFPQAIVRCHLTVHGHTKIEVQGELPDTKTMIPGTITFLEEQ